MTHNHPDPRLTPQRNVQRNVQCVVSNIQFLKDVQLCVESMKTFAMEDVWENSM
jgi:hypothetical protein